MNIKSASGLPTPKTVCVRDLARCAHCVQAQTRSRIASSNAALFEAGCGDRLVGDADVSRRETATGETVCNCASARIDARGTPSLDSRIFCSAAITKSRAGCVIVSTMGNFPRRSNFFCRSPPSRPSNRPSQLPFLLTPTFRPVICATVDSSRFNGLRFPKSR